MMVRRGGGPFSSAVLADARGWAHGEVEAVKNFLAGLLLGTMITYLYFTGGGSLRGLLDEWWTEASAPPPHRAQSRNY